MKVKEEMMNVATESGEAVVDAASEVVAKTSPKTLLVIGGGAVGITLLYFTVKAIDKKIKAKKAEKKETEPAEKEAAVEPEVAD